MKSKLVKAGLLPKAKIGVEDNLEEKYPLSSHIQELDAVLATTELTSEKGIDDEKAQAKLLSNKVVSEEVSNIVKVISALLRGEEPAKQAKTERSKQDPALESNEKQVKKKQVEHVKSKEKTLLTREMGEMSAEEVDSGQDFFSGDEEDIPPRVVFENKASKAPPTSKNGKRLKDSDEQNDNARPAKQRRTATQDGSSDEDISSDEGEAGHALPALSTGFVGGKGFNLGRDSEDEWSDGDAELDSIDEDADGTGNHKEARKNRMGQRARRAIWEKKFGKGANHLKLLEKEAKQRRPKETYNRRDQNGPTFRDAGWSGPLGKEQGPKDVTRPALSKTNPPKVEAEMHPSWIAKQKQKEKAEAAARDRGTAKKIVFD